MQLAVILNERYADLQASLADTLCLEAERSNCNFVPHGSRKIRCAYSSKIHVCAVPTEESLNSFKGGGGDGGGGDGGGGGGCGVIVIDT